MVDVPTRDEHSRLGGRVTAAEGHLAGHDAELRAVDGMLDIHDTRLDDLAARLAILEQGNPPPPPPPVLPTVQPVWAATVLAGFGVNAHPGWSTGVYGQTDALVANLTDLGLPMVRDRMGGTLTAKRRATLERLAAAGIRQHATVGLVDDTEAAVRAAAEIVAGNPDLFCSAGGINEPNATGAGWPAKTAARQQWLYGQVAGRVPVCGPALKDNVPDIGGDFDALAATGIGAWVDAADCHRYPRGLPPGSAAGGIGERLVMARDAFGTDRVWLTEVGYNTSGSGIDEATQGVYATRALLDSWWAGVERTFLFELYDQSTDPAVHAGHFGLIATEGTDPAGWRRKPAFTMVAALAELLADPGPKYVPLPVEVSVTGPDDLRHLVLGWRDGTARVLAWRNAPAGVAAEPVTVTTATGPTVTQLAADWMTVRLR